MSPSQILLGQKGIQHSATQMPDLPNPEPFSRLIVSNLDYDLCVHEARAHRFAWFANLQLFDERLSKGWR